MTQSPLVSIIIPVYNSEKYLKEALNSVLNQTYRNLEIVCVDDHSTDRSREIIKKLQAQDPRIKLIEFENNKGPSVARNAALDVCTGDFISFFDSDDILLPNFVADLLEVIEGEKSSVVVSLLEFYTLAAPSNREKVELWERTGKISHFIPPLIGSKDALSLSNQDVIRHLFHIPAGTCFKFFRAHERALRLDLSLKDLRFDAKLKSGEDFVWTVDLILNSSRVTFLNKSNYLYRMRPDSLSHQKTNIQLDNLYMFRRVKQILDKYGLYPKLQTEFEQMIYISFTSNLKLIPESKTAEYWQRSKEFFNSIGLELKDSSFIKRKLLFVQYHFVNKEKAVAVRTKLDLLKCQHKVYKFVTRGKR